MTFFSTFLTIFLVFVVKISAVLTKVMIESIPHLFIRHCYLNFLNFLPPPWLRYCLHLLCPTSIRDPTNGSYAVNWRELAAVDVGCFRAVQPAADVDLANSFAAKPSCCLCYCYGNASPRDPSAESAAGTHDRKIGTQMA